MTYSIVAHDSATGELGVGVQSHWFSVGSVVSWAEPAVGAVATQSIAEPAYGPRLLERLGAGAKAGEALESLLDADESSGFRQVAVAAADGEVAVHTGEGCIPFAGHVTGDGFSVQANMMASAEVWPAMADAFASTEGTLARRILATLEAAEEAGGDVRGKQSAALVVVPPVGEAWQRTVELRIEDHPAPLGELARLVGLREAYTLMDEADNLASQGRYDETAERFMQAMSLAPDNPELLFWGGLGMASQGMVDEGVELVKRAIATHAGWRDLLERLDPGIAPGAPRVRGALRL
jgi:uncharacterized Ntn-hydrolase superfamily protein